MKLARVGSPTKESSHYIVGLELRYCRRKDDEHPLEETAIKGKKINQHHVHKCIKCKVKYLPIQFICAF
jgi:hypothetical protein